MMNFCYLFLSSVSGNFNFSTASIMHNKKTQVLMVKGKQKRSINSFLKASENSVLKHN